MTQQKSVTLVISHTLDPEHGKRYEQWLGKIMPVAAEFPGHLGANVIRPAPGQNLWSVIIRFDTIEHLYAWTQSETRRELVAGGLDDGKVLRVVGMAATMRLSDRGPGDAINRRISLLVLNQQAEQAILHENAESQNESLDDLKQPGAVPSAAVPTSPPANPR